MAVDLLVFIGSVALACSAALVLALRGRSLAAAAAFVAVAFALGAALDARAQTDPITIQGWTLDYSTLPFPGGDGITVSGRPAFKVAIFISFDGGPWGFVDVFDLGDEDGYICPTDAGVNPMCQAHVYVPEEGGGGGGGDFDPSSPAHLLQAILAVLGLVVGLWGYSMGRSGP